MNRQDLINQITEEIAIGADLGHEYEHTAQNIVAICEGSREHIDYESLAHANESEKP